MKRPTHNEEKWTGVKLWGIQGDDQACEERNGVEQNPDGQNGLAALVHGWKWEGTDT